MANRQYSSLLWSGCRNVPAPAGCDNASENGNGETIDTIPILNTAIAAQASGPFQPSTTTRLPPTAGSVGHRAGLRRRSGMGAGRRRPRRHDGNGHHHRSQLGRPPANWNPAMTWTTSGSTWIRSGKGRSNDLRSGGGTDAARRTGVPLWTGRPHWTTPACRECPCQRTSNCSARPEPCRSTGVFD